MKKRLSNLMKWNDGDKEDGGSDQIRGFDGKRGFVKIPSAFERS